MQELSISSRRGAEPSRRGFLKNSLAAGAGLIAGLSAQPGDALAQSSTRRLPSTYHGYVAFQGEDKIRLFTMEADSGRLIWQEDVVLSGGPAVLAVDPAKKYLYVGQRGSNDLSSYRINQQTGSLSLIGTTPLQGEPVQISTDRTGRFLLSAYWHQSTVGVHAIDKNGAVTFPPVEWRHTDHGAHSIHTDLSNRYAFVPHTAGGDRANAIFQFKFDAETGRLTPNTPVRLSLQDELGPRHICFHPTRNIVYASNEQGVSVTAYELDTAKGTLTPVQTVPTVPKGESAAPADIHITPSGAFVYVSNRGHNSIASFVVDPSSGRLTFTGVTATPRMIAARAGQFTGPRTFSLDPAGRFLVAADLDSGRFGSYRIDEATGRLTPLETYDGGKTPMWVLITTLSR